MNTLAKKITAAAGAALILFSTILPVSAIEMKTGIGTVTAGSLRLRSAPNTNAEVLSNASSGDKVVIIRKTDNWYLVDYNLKIGYMSADYLDFDAVKNIDLGPGRAEESSANIRSAPNGESTVVAHLPQGQTANIIGFNNGWYKVVYDGTTGYIRSDLLALTQKPACNSADSPSSIGETVVATAKDYMGVRYVWGGTSPTSGFDCSGFVQYVLKKCGYSISRTADEQMDCGTPVSKDSLRIGDLVFFGSGDYADHVGIYAGNGSFIHSAGSGVKITALSSSYYAGCYIGARRIF